MDLDIRGVEVGMLKDTVMKILEHDSFQAIFKPFGIEKVLPPDMSKAKQTEITQRFKAHIITSAGEDLFTKIEFSRRGFKGNAVIEPVADIVLRQYKMAPVVIPHYDVMSAVIQKISALAGRSTVQARDIFDLYVLSGQCKPVCHSEKPCHCEDSSRLGFRPRSNNILRAEPRGGEVEKQGFEITSPSKTDCSDMLARARDNAFEVSFEQFRDTVVSYLAEEDRGMYDSPPLWDEIRLKAVSFIEELRRQK